MWAADARDGLHGGAFGLRWVRPGDDGRKSFASLSRTANRIRVMPFLEGIPASIHGIVFRDAVAVFRPVEMVVLRPTTGDRLLYAGCATAFDPKPGDREAMRDFAHRVGTALRERVGYRGPFGVDGIVAEEGLLPTEMNPRSGAAFTPLGQGLGGLPLTPSGDRGRAARLPTRSARTRRRRGGGRAPHQRGLVCHRQEIRRERYARRRAGWRRIPRSPARRMASRQFPVRTCGGRGIPALRAASKANSAWTVRLTRSCTSVPLRRPAPGNTRLPVGARAASRCPRERRKSEFHWLGDT